MRSSENCNIIFIKLNTNEDFFKSLSTVCNKHRINNGVILSGIGQLKKFTIGYYKKNYGYITKNFLKSHELLHLSGNIIKNNDDFEFHIHAILSNEEMKSIGGHLINGKVDITNEIIILKTNIKISRNLEKSTGLKKIKFG